MSQNQAASFRIGQRYLVFILAFIAGAESLAQAVAAFLDQRLDQMVLWFTPDAAIVVFAWLAARIKITGGEYV